MYKTRTVGYVGKTRKVRSLTRSRIDGETPVVKITSPVRPRVNVPKNLFKSPIKASTYSLGVTYNVRSTPTGATPSHPLARCRKCKHLNMNHHGHQAKNNLLGIGPRQTRSVTKGIGTAPVAKPAVTGAANSFSQDTGSIVQQIKANIAISPYVRHYLERKLKEKLQNTNTESGLLRSVSGINLGELELIYNLDQQPDEEWSAHTDSNKTRASARVLPTPATTMDTPVSSLRGRTRVIRRLTAAPKSELFKPKSSIDARKAASSKRTAATAKQSTTDASTKSHQYFTRTQARMMQAKQKVEPNASASSKANILSDDELFEPIKTSKTRKARNVMSSTASTTAASKRFTRQCTKTTAVTESVRKTRTAKTTKPHTPAPVQSRIPRFTGGTTAAKRQLSP